MADNTEGPRKLDVPKDLEVEKLVRPAADAYRESDDHVHNPYWQYGNLDTSDVGGSAHQSISDVSNVFAVGRARTLVTAARALDPEDDGVGADLVVLPSSTVTVQGADRTADEGRGDVEVALKRLVDSPVEVGGAAPQARLAAEAEETQADAEEAPADNGRHNRRAAGAANAAATTEK